LELKHRAPKVITCLVMSAKFSMLLLVQLFLHPVFCCCDGQQCALLPDIHVCLLHHDALHLHLMLLSFAGMNTAKHEHT